VGTTATGKMVWGFRLGELLLGSSVATGHLIPKAISTTSISSLSVLLSGVLPCYSGTQPTRGCHRRWMPTSTVPCTDQGWRTELDETICGANAPPLPHASAVSSIPCHTILPPVKATEPQRFCDPTFS
jgi:hypothetical protein